MSIIATENSHASGAYRLRDVVLVRGEGAHVWDQDGRSYVDCMAGIAVASIGHCHPRLVAAIGEQARRLITCHATVPNAQRADFLSRLAEVTPAGIDRFFLCNSGTEAVEGAIKFARLSTGRTDVVAACRGFHGRTLGALSATHTARYRQGFQPLVPGFTHVPFNNLERLEEAIGPQTAAVIVEPVQGEGGLHVATVEYLQALRAACDRQGALLIIDEVQTGLGRTGHWFGCQLADIVPDLICIGKALAGGVPMAAVALGPDVERITPGCHGSTFGGNPLACAAGKATLDIIEDEGLVARARTLGASLRGQLQAIDSDLVREVRGSGLMLGVDLRVRAAPVTRALTDHGILAMTSGSTVVRLVPPLVIDEASIQQVVGALATVLSTVSVEQGATTTG